MRPQSITTTLSIRVNTCQLLHDPLLQRMHIASPAEGSSAHAAVQPCTGSSQTSVSSQSEIYRLLQRHFATLIPCSGERFISEFRSQSTQIAIKFRAFSGRRCKRDRLAQDARGGEHPGCAFERSAERIQFCERLERVSDALFVSQFVLNRETRFQDLLRAARVSMQHGKPQSRLCLGVSQLTPNLLTQIQGLTGE